MAEAERRAAFEASVLAIFQSMLIYMNATDHTTKVTALMLSAIGDIVENLRTLHEAAVDAPCIYTTHVPAERMTGDSVVVEPQDGESAR